MMVHTMEAYSWVVFIYYILLFITGRYIIINLFICILVDRSPLPALAPTASAVPPHTPAAAGRFRGPRVGVVPRAAAQDFEGGPDPDPQPDLWPCIRACLA